MRVYDPYAHRFTQLGALHTLAAPGVIPAKSETGDWFAIKPLTGESFKLSDLSQEDVVVANRAIGIHTVTEELSVTCAWVRDGFFPKAGAKTEAQIVESYGNVVIAAAKARVKHDGYTDEEIATAITHLGENPNRTQLLEGVETVK